jgi:16S rRNA (cytosine967-C5)-methyltransferase
MLHPILVHTVTQALFSIFGENRHADKVIEYTLRQNPKAGSRDRAFIAETTYEIVRYYRLYCEVAGKTPQQPEDFWIIAGIHFIRQGLTLPEWNEFSDLSKEKIKERLQAAAQQRVLRESIPDWMDAVAAAELPDIWEPTLSWLNRPAQVVLRANRLKTNRMALVAALNGENIEAKPVGDQDALVLSRRQNVFRTKAFMAGHFEVQDFSSQLVAPLLAPEPGMRVVDACAGGGGKSLHLAALMQNKGSLIALDTLSWKLNELRTRARRAGATNIETRPIENKKVIKRLYDTADRLLLDVPCSGLGVLRRNPDSKWKLTQEQLEHLKTVQADILQTYSRITKPGGRMVYATCSILPSENRAQVDRFLQSEAGKDFALLQEQPILPQDAGFDGFYMALLERNG